MMPWTENDNGKLAKYMEKLENKKRELDEKLGRINNLRKVGGKIQTRIITSRGEPDKNGKVQDVIKTIKPKDTFGVELSDDYRLDQLTKLVTATDLETGVNN